MKKTTLTEKKAEQTPTGGVLVGKRKGQTIIHDKGSLSGYLVGKTHAEGGIKAVNKSTGQPLEMQGGEVVITAPAVADQTKREFNGEMLTNREILSKINVSGGGVSLEDGGDISKVKHTGASYNYGGRTMTDYEIIQEINSCGCEHSDYKNGGHLAEGLSLRDIADIHNVSIADLKKEVRAGLKAESEHTASKREQMKIVKDHLLENPKYYTLLDKAGLEKGGSLGEGENDKVKYLIDRDLDTDIAEHNLKMYLKEKGYSDSKYGLLSNEVKSDSKYKELKHKFDIEFSKSRNKPTYKYPKTRDRVQDQKDLRRYKEILNEVINDKMKKGGSLVKDAKSGNTPARDLNNYNDVLDVDADGVVGAETGLFNYGGDIDIDADGTGGADASSGVGAFEDGGDVYEYAEGGQTLSAEVFEWNKVPTNYRNISKVKKVPFTNNPLDKGLDNIISPFLDKDPINPRLNGVNFDDNGITATNAHILVTLPYPNDKYNGIYDVNKAKKEKSSELLLIDSSYANYQGVIPKSEDAGVSYLIDVYKLLQYTKTALNYANKIYAGISYKYGDNESVGFNGKFLVEILNALLKLGHEKVYVFIQTSSRAILISPNKKYELGSDEILLIMPMMLNKVGINDGEFGAKDSDYNRSLEAYFDFNDSEIHNADGSVAEFKMKYENNLSVDDKYLALLSKMISKNKRLDILNYAKVEDGKMTATDLDVDLIIKDVNMPNGMYSIFKNAPSITMEAVEDFPKRISFDKNEYITHHGDKKNTAFEFVTFSEVFDFYLDKLLLSTRKDDLRPIYSGICIKKTYDNELFLVSTNANTLCKINITDYCDFNKDNRDLEYVLPTKYLKDFVKLTEGSLHFKCGISNIFIEADNLEYVAQVIDGKYPNYEAVIPKDNNKTIAFDHALINKCLNSKEAKDFASKYKDKNHIIDFMNSGDKLFVRAYEYMGYNNPRKIIAEEELCSIDFSYKEENKTFNTNDSIFLLMPTMNEQKMENQYFCFRKEFFEVMLDTITDTQVECYFTEPNRAYLFPIDAIDYKKTLPEEKTKQQPKKVAEAIIKEINDSENEELKEAIETLKMLLETTRGKSKKEILEALEILEMLNEK